MWYGLGFDKVFLPTPTPIPTPIPTPTHTPTVVTQPM